MAAPGQNFTVGRDVQCVVIAPNGTRLDLTGVTDFQWTPEYQKPRSQPLNSPPIERFLPNGHRLRLTLDRRGPANEALFAQIEQGWWNNGSVDPGTSAGGTMYFYITETDGSQTTHMFQNVALMMTSAGDFRIENPVKQTLEGFASVWSKV